MHTSPAEDRPDRAAGDDTRDSAEQHCVIVRQGAVLDVRTGAYRTADVVCRDGRIEAIADQADTSGAAEEIDARDTFVVPGLIDAHVHVTAASADLGANETIPATLLTAHSAQIMRGMLARGFTTVRDMGGADHGLSAAQRVGLITGPRLLYCGHALSQTGGHGDFRTSGDDSEASCGHGVGRVVDGIPAVRAAARDELRKGADHLKVMASGGVASPTDRLESTQFSIEELQAIVGEATAAGRYVAAHAYTPPAITHALEAGARSIEHGNLIDPDTLGLVRERHAFLVPTLVTYWALQREGMAYGQSSVSAAKNDGVLNAGLQALSLAHDAGVPIAFGTDLLGGMHRHQNEEFRIRAEVQPLLTVLQSATIVAAALLNRAGDLGEVTVGATADLLLYERDPLDDVAVLSEPRRYLRTIVQDGRTRPADGGFTRATD